MEVIVRNIQRAITQYYKEKIGKVKAGALLSGEILPSYSGELARIFWLSNFEKLCFFLVFVNRC